MCKAASLEFVIPGAVRSLCAGDKGAPLLARRSLWAPSDRWRRLSVRSLPSPLKKAREALEGVEQDGAGCFGLSLGGPAGDAPLGTEPWWICVQSQLEWMAVPGVRGARSRVETTADPSTPLRYAQDDRLVERVNGSGRVEVRGIPPKQSLDGAPGGLLARRSLWAFVRRWRGNCKSLRPLKKARGLSG